MAHGQCRPCQPWPTQGDGGDRELPHRGARRSCCALRRLRARHHRLQFLPQPALPEVPGPIIACCIPLPIDKNYDDKNGEKNGNAYQSPSMKEFTSRRHFDCVLQTVPTGTADARLKAELIALARYLRFRSNRPNSHHGTIMSKNDG
jgi:hypothetical protein